MACTPDEEHLSTEICECGGKSAVVLSRACRCQAPNSSFGIDYELFSKSLFSKN